AYRFARIAKFVVGWASHLYYWVYPGLMVGVTAVVLGYVVGQLWPETFSANVPSPLFMFAFCAVMSYGVAYICFRGVSGTRAVNAAINVIQISALIVFSVIAIGYRMNHPEGSMGLTLDANGNPAPAVVSYAQPIQNVPDPSNNNAPVTKFMYHGSASSVVAPHAFSYVVIQACI